MIRLLTRGSQVLLDVLVLSLAYVLAFLLRFEFDPDLQAYKLLFFTLPYVVLFQYLVLALFGVPRFSWRYVGIREAGRVLMATVTSVGTLVVIRLTLAPFGGYAIFVTIPLGVLGMDMVLAFLAIIGVRVLRRVQAEGGEIRQLEGSAASEVRTLLVGAGQAGLLVAREIARRPDLGIRAVGFLDDDPLKVGTVVHGIKVLGTTDQLGAFAEKRGADQALITIASATGADIRRLNRLCREAGLATQIIPGIHEIVGGQVNLSRIRPVAIEDLLGRAPVHLDIDAISATVEGRVVMVTGAGGSIGSELCRQACRFQPERLILVDRSENNLFLIHRELLAAFADIPVEPCIADICDAERMEALFAELKPVVVLHAAAHKHVPMMEWNAAEAVKNNILGTRLLADLADAHGVAEFVMISTDKAVNPTSVMGATKRVAEIYVQALSQRSKTCFVAVRFGNVLGSAGSVIPIFKNQIADGGPVTVTHPEMRRYFMTIPEACQLVLQASTMAEGGEIFILDMGEPVAIVDLARELIRLSGLQVGTDIEIEFTGMRPGEKLFEELSVAEERADKTRHSKVFVGKIRPAAWEQVVAGIEHLASRARKGDATAVRAALGRMVPEYQAPSTQDDASEVSVPSAGVEAGL
jgi:FlaA1/EpsC-like NDP-sugar epimerase